MTIKTPFTNHAFQILAENEISMFAWVFDKIHYFHYNYKTYEYESKCGLKGKQKMYNAILNENTVHKCCTECFNLGAGQ